MSLFKKNRAPRAASTSGRAGYSIIAAGTTVLGDIEAEGTLRVDGTVAGSILRADAVMIGAQGSVTGDVTAREVVVAGRVEGTISAAGRTELQATAYVAGAIETASIAVHEGAAVRGQLSVRMTAESSNDALPITPKLVAAGGER